MNLVTCEQVGRGHPDKICDTISDIVLKMYLDKDTNAHVAIETSIKNNKINIFGEISSNINIPKYLIKRRINKYLSDLRINNKKFEINFNISKQSKDINDKVKLGAGDQGIVYGYATNETDSYLPYPYEVSCKIIDYLENKAKIDNRFGFDTKCLVTYNYETSEITNIVIAASHTKDIAIEEVRTNIYKYLKPYFNQINLNSNCEININSAGPFLYNPSYNDAGLTGRKIIADTYGGIGHHGGGAFSGKDFTKIDRSAAYMTREVAKNLVKNNYCNKCEIMISYEIGKPNPVAIDIDTFGTGKMSNKELYDYVVNNFDLSVEGLFNFCMKYYKPNIVKNSVNGTFFT